MNQVRFCVLILLATFVMNASGDSDEGDDPWEFPPYGLQRDRQVQALCANYGQTLRTTLTTTSRQEQQ